MRIARVVRTYSCAYRNGNRVSETPLLIPIIRTLRLNSFLVLREFFLKYLGRRLQWLHSDQARIRTNIKLRSAVYSIYSPCLRSDFVLRYRIIEDRSCYCHLGRRIERGRRDAVHSIANKKAQKRASISSCEIRSQVLRAVSIRVRKMLQRETSYRCALFPWNYTIEENTYSPVKRPPPLGSACTRACPRFSVRFYEQPLTDFLCA